MLASPVDNNRDGSCRADQNTNNQCSPQQESECSVRNVREPMHESLNSSDERREPDLFENDTSESQARDGGATGCSRSSGNGTCGVSTREESCSRPEKEPTTAADFGNEDLKNCSRSNRRTCSFGDEQQTDRKSLRASTSSVRPARAPTTDRRSTNNRTVNNRTSTNRTTNNRTANSGSIAIMEFEKELCRVEQRREQLMRCIENKQRELTTENQKNRSSLQCGRSSDGEKQSLHDTRERRSSSHHDTRHRRSSHHDSREHRSSYHDTRERRSPQYATNKCRPPQHDTSERRPSQYATNQCRPPQHDTSERRSSQCDTNNCSRLSQHETTGCRQSHNDFRDHRSSHHDTRGRRSSQYDTRERQQSQYDTRERQPSQYATNQCRPPQHDTSERRSSQCDTNNNCSRSSQHETTGCRQSQNEIREYRPSQHEYRERRSSQDDICRERRSSQHYATMDRRPSQNGQDYSRDCIQPSQDDTCCGEQRPPQHDTCRERQTSQHEHRERQSSNCESKSRKKPLSTFIIECFCNLIEADSSEPRETERPQVQHDECSYQPPARGMSDNNNCCPDLQVSSRHQMDAPRKDAVSSGRRCCSSPRSTPPNDACNNAATSRDSVDLNHSRQ